MTRIRIAVAGVALGGALLFGPAHATPPLPRPPPEEWAPYLAAVKVADPIEDDEARCKSYPDLPGNQWRPGAAEGRCTLLRRPALTLEQIDSLIAVPDGVLELERRFKALLEGHHGDQSQREQIFISMRVFDESPRAHDVAQRWLKLAPESAFALTAVGSHFEMAGWNARGKKVARETTDDQLRRMNGFFARAVPLFARALEIEPRLSVACSNLSAIGRQSSGELQAFAAAHCLKVDPDSYYVVWEQLVSAQPRWGGSEERMRYMVAYAAARTERNPILGALLGEAAGHRASLADNYGPVADELAGASRMAPSGTLMAHAGNGYWNNKDYWRAVAYYSQATRFWPRDAKYRRARAALLSAHLKDFSWARSDMRVALQQEPDDPRYNMLMGTIVESLESPSAARPHYRRAMSGATRQEAMEQYCMSFLIGTVEKEADACTLGLVEAFPESARSWYMRARATAVGDPAAAVAAIKQFKLLADPRNETHRRSLDELATIEAKLLGDEAQLGQGR